MPSGQREPWHAITGPKNKQARMTFCHAGLRCKNPAIPTLALVALPSALEA